MAAFVNEGGFAATNGMMFHHFPEVNDA